MAERRKMVIEVELDLTPAQNQMRGFVAANNRLTLPVQSPVPGAAAGTGIGGAAAVGLAATTAEQTAVAAALGKAEANAAQYSLGAASASGGGLLAAGRGGGFLGAPRLMSLMFNAGFGLMEVGRAASGIRNAEMMAGFANTPEEANLLRAEAIEQGSQGFFGSMVWGLGNAFGWEGSPAQVAQQARESVALRRGQDELRGRLFDVQDSRSVRDAYSVGGQTAAEGARAAAISARRIDEITQRSNNLSAKLNERTPTEVRLVASASGETADYVTTGGENVLTGSGRAQAQLEFNAAQQELQNARDQARFEAQRRLERDADTRRSVAGATRRANMAVGGATLRDLQWYDLGIEGMEGMVAGYRQRGWEGLLEAGGLAVARGGAELANRRREDNLESARSRSAVLADTYRAQGNPFQATLVEMRAATETQALIADHAKGPAAGAMVRAEGMARIGAVTAQQNRAFTSDVLGLTTANAVLASQLADNPLGAQIAGLRGNQQAALNAVTAPGIFGDIQRGLINANASLGEQLATRNFERARSDANLRLEGAIERAQLSITGGPSRFIRQQISGIVEQNEEDVRGFIRAGMPAEAERRRELGRLQLKQTEAEFFRSIQYREASPRGVYGTGTLGDVSGAFDAAQAAVSKSGAGDSEKPATSQDIKDLGLLLQRLLTNGIAAIAS